MNQKKLANKNAIAAITIICALVSAGIAAGVYANYTAIIREKDQTAKSLNDRILQLQLENQTALYEAMQTSLNAQIALLQNQVQDYQAQVNSLNAQITTLRNQAASSGGQTDSATAQIAILQQQVSDLQSQIATKDASIDSLNRVNTASSLANFNDTAIWLDQTSGTYAQIAKQTVNAGNTLTITGLNLVSGKIYYVTLDMTMNAQPGGSATADLYANGDTETTHYDTSFLYGNPQWSWPHFQYEDDARILDNNLFVASKHTNFAGVMAIDPIGTLRLSLTYNAQDASTSDPVTGLYAWTYNGTTVTAVNRLTITSTNAVTGTLTIYDMQP